MDALSKSVEEFRASFPIAAIPTVVLTALTPVGDAALKTAADMVRWWRFQAALVRRLPGAARIVLPTANHGTILQESALRESILKVLGGVTRR